MIVFLVFSLFSPRFNPFLFYYLNKSLKNSKPKKFKSFLESSDPSRENMYNESKILTPVILIL